MTTSPVLMSITVSSGRTQVHILILPVVLIDAGPYKINIINVESNDSTAWYI